MLNYVCAQPRLGNIQSAPHNPSSVVRGRAEARGQTRKRVCIFLCGGPCNRESSGDSARGIFLGAKTRADGVLHHIHWHAQAITHAYVPVWCSRRMMFVRGGDCVLQLAHLWADKGSLTPHRSPGAFSSTNLTNPPQSHNVGPTVYILWS